MALDVPPAEMDGLPSRLRAVAPPALERMRRRLSCARSLLWYGSIYGDDCDVGASGGPDAFDALMATLAARLVRDARAPLSGEWFWSACLGKVGSAARLHVRPD